MLRCPSAITYFRRLPLSISRNWTAFRGSSIMSHQAHSRPSSLSGPSEAKRPRPNTKNAHTSRHGSSGKRRPKHVEVEPVLLKDMLTLLGWKELPAYVRGDEGETFGEQKWPRTKPEEKFGPWQFTEDIFHVVGLSSHGDGLAVWPETGEPKWVVIVPFGLPGDRVRAKIVRHGRYHSHAEPLETLPPLKSGSAEQPESITTIDAQPDRPQLTRDSSLIGCQYFGKCAGCQYQHLPYQQQLELKRWVLVKAMRNFSGLEQAEIPEIQPTIASPLQYGYRTKITPHFEVGKGEVPIGFEEKCRSKILDIEECPIATKAINDHLPEARRSVKENIDSYKRGATLLLRDSIVVDVEDEEAHEAGQVKIVQPETRECITNHKKTVTEKVGDVIFQFPAGSFFQNNASILLPLTEFVRDQIRRDAGETYLVDAYCGSGLFSLTLASHFTSVCGIEIDPASIKFATHNAQVNGIDNVTFHAGASEAIFDPIVKKLGWNGDKTTLIVDPPRKGCDAGFLKQAVAFKPHRIVYVSCNVHTMAANAGDLVRWSREAYGEGKGYVIKSLGAIDLFPQTHHTEGLMVMEREVEAEV